MGKKPKTPGKAVLRVSAQTHDTLRVIAEDKGSSMQKIMDDAVEAYRREMILEESSEAYASLAQDPQAWSEVEAERNEWDATLNDGLEG